MVKTKALDHGLSRTVFSLIAMRLKYDGVIKLGAVAALRKTR